MVRFKIGPSPINVSDLSITWPNNSFLGISPANATTATLVSALNSTVLSCGYMLEPTGGVLPAGKTILLITSTEMCTTANSFANLSDTIYVIFQNAGNYQGHFVNYSSTPGLRTTIFKQISTGCADTVIYDKSLLVNQLGTYGGSASLNDGATVEFSWPGVANYVNKGCSAPFVTNTANAGTSTSVCPGGSISLNGTATGSYTGVIWQGGTGSFSSPTTASTNYTAGPGDSGTITLSFGVIGHCQDTVFSSVNMVINPLPVAAISSSGSTVLCAGNTVTLTASGGSSYSWSTGASGSSISVNTAGTYTVTASNSCGTATDTQSVYVVPLPTAVINPAASTSFCAGGSVTLNASGSGPFSWSTGSSASSINVSTAGTYTLTASNSCGTATDTQSVYVTPLPVAGITPAGSTTLCQGEQLDLSVTGSGTYIWSDGSTGSMISVNTAGNYYAVVSNACGNDTAYITVSVDAVTALFTSDVITGIVPLNVNFTNGSSASAVNYFWDFGNGQTSSLSNPAVSYTTGGNYTVTLTVTNANGCTDVYSITIVVVENPSVLTVPNTFSPNGDNENDLFYVSSSGISSFHCSIYDRWGLKMVDLENQVQNWDGRNGSGQVCPDGTYYYLIKASGIDGKMYDLKGFIELIR